ncbi:CBO0543 family protein [Neobacillus novalis]|uniref:CBO0543 family protein n=1 Tax=Neobacillus novalis TaxID=220687 RepID=A0AA95MNJ5_9BACI|nr:CBO0543 family protein [Neobacillus novalis]WHY87262.1 CBO0543 family protein [Neobacillus novalis]
MHFIFNGLFLLAGIKWGNWRKWRGYYPTILFFIIGDLLKNFLFYNYRFWMYKETILAENILRNHAFISIMIMFVVYPSTIMIYLGHFPQGKVKAAFWIFFWVFLFSSVEYINLHYLNLIEHHHGWSMYWSFFFNIVMFSVLRIHYKHPLLAWGLSAVWILFLWNVFEIPIEKVR